MADKGRWQEGLERVELAEEEFTELMLLAIQEDFPSASVTVAGPRTIVVEISDSTNTFSLDNAWLECVHTPDNRAEIFHRYLNTFVLFLNRVSEKPGPSREQIVPVVKNRLFVEGLPVSSDLFLCETFAADLVVVYVIDTPDGIAWLHESELGALELRKENLRELAVDNLGRLLPNVQRVGDAGIYGFVAGGNYESSLLLVDRLWNDAGSTIDGDPVAAVPCRDLLLYTGSGSPELIQKMKGIVSMMFDEGSHPISGSLIVRRCGEWFDFQGEQG